MMNSKVEKEFEMFHQVDHATLNRIYDKIDYDIDVDKHQEQFKKEINMVVIGHVDSGKSTLMGHILFKLGYVSKH